MCDILDKPCKTCGTLLPVHLGDYETAPEEVECYCEKHLPEKDCRIFTLIEDSIEKEYTYTHPEEGGPATRELKGERIEFPKGWKMGIRALTDNAREYKDYNHPNTYADFEEVDI
jgi:hypothetical protein